MGRKQPGCSGLGGPWATPCEPETIRLASQPVLVSSEARAPLPGSTRALGLEEKLRWSAP